MKLLSKLFTLAFLACSITLLQGQCDQFISLNSQEEVNAFNCTNLDDGIYIGGNDITDLSPLSMLESVGGTLVLENLEINNLTGLENIHSVESVVVSMNSNLSSLTGLNITSLTESIIIQNNPNLADISALSGISGSVGYILLTDCGMTSLNGLQNITETDTDLIIQGCNNLINLDELENVSYVGGTLAISSNNSLINIDGAFTNLENSQFNVSGNSQLNDCCILWPLIENALGFPIPINENGPDCSDAVTIQFLCDESACAIPELMLSTQAAVDAFSCTNFDGNITIDGDDITDLSAMSSLESITGFLDIRNTQLTDLSGLENLTTTLDGISLVENDLLANVDALSNLASTDYLVILQNDLLENLDGFAGIQGTIGFLYVSNNQVLADVDGLLGITEVQAIEWGNNPALDNINGLSNITTATLGHILIAGTSLTNLNGLSGLTDITSLVISGNDFLENLNGISNIQTLSGALVIIDNAVLTDISAIPQNLEIEQNLIIENNPMLSACCAITDVSFSDVAISNNDVGCEAIIDIFLNCGATLCSGDITLSTQAQVDAFGPCVDYDGTIIISGEDITNVANLAGISTISGGLEITNCPNLLTLDGLESLTSVNGIALFNCESLNNIDAIQNLQGDLDFYVIIQLPALENFEGITNLNGSVTTFLFQNTSVTSINLNQGITAVTDYIEIFGNSNMTTLVDLPDFTPQTDLQFLSNVMLENTDAFAGIQEMGSLTFVGNGVQNLDGFSNLETVHGTVVIVDNNNITNLDGLASLNTIGSSLILDGNTSLTNVDALSENLVITNSLIVTNNTLLDDCCAFTSIINNNTLTETDINNNAANCNSLIDIAANCNVQFCAGDITLSTQAQIDAFACETYDGNINISGDDITNINSFAGLITLTGSLEIVSCPNLENLNGLEDLTSVGGVAVVSCESINNIDATQNIQGDLGFFVLMSLPALQNFDGITNLDGNLETLIISGTGLSSFDATQGISSITSYFEISGNENMTTIAGIPNLTPSTDVQMIGNTMLENVDAFSSATALSSLTFVSNNVSNLDGFSNITSIDGTLVLVDNPQITNLDGLASLNNITFELILEGSSALTDVNGLNENLFIGNSLYVIDNTLLEDCCAFTPILLNNTLENVEFQDNGFSCNAVTDIYLTCGITLSSDLEVTIESFQDEYYPLEIISSTVTVTNFGDIAAENVQVSIPLVENAGYAGSNNSYDAFNGIWNAGTVPAGESVSILISYWGPADGSDFNLYAEIISTITEDIDSTPGNGAGTVNEDDEAMLTIAQTPLSGTPDLAFGFNYFQDNTYIAGSVSEFNITMFNLGTNVSPEESGTAYLSSDNMLDNGDIALNSFDIPALGINHFGQIAFDMTLPADLAADNYFIIVVMDDDNSLEELNEDNNTYLQAIVIEEASAANTIDLELDLDASTDQFGLYQNVIYTLTVTNNSDVDANDIEIDFQVPEGMAFVEKDLETGNWYNWIGIWNVYNLPANSSRTMEVTLYTIENSTAITTFAQVLSVNEFDMDSTPGNDTDQSADEDDEAVVTITPYNFFLLENNDNTFEETNTRLQTKNETFVANATVFPNPTTDYINVEWTSDTNSKIELYVTDITGRTLIRKNFISQKGLNQKLINLADLKSGIFTVSLQNKGLSHSLRFVIE